MMGKQKDPQEQLFIPGISLENRIRKDHPLRKVKEMINFNFVYDLVKDTYGTKGNVSVPPPVILKMMFLLFFYNVRSERELMATIPERLDWLWFLGYTLSDDVPDHSVLSKARLRWGPDVFQTLFLNVLQQCINAGLVEGKKIFCDASLIDADASNNSVLDTHKLSTQLKKNFKRIEGRLDDIKAKKKTPSDARYISSTDPDASVTRHGGGRSKLRYKTHRAVDPANEVITATSLSSGSVDDGHMLETLIEEHEKNTGHKLETAVADSKYGTMDNFLLCRDKKIKAHMPFIEKKQRRTGRRKGIFPPETFIYNKDEDTFTCPAGKVLRKRAYYKKKKQFEYKAQKDACAQCELQDQCTRSKAGRTVKRHIRQDELDRTLKEANTPTAKKDIRKRQDLSERSFAASTRHGLKRARWRGQWRMQIQDFLIATIQNILILISKPNNKISKSNTMEKEVNARAHAGLYYLFNLVFRFIIRKMGLISDTNTFVKIKFHFVGSEKAF